MTDTAGKQKEGVGHTPLPWRIDGEGRAAMIRGADVTIVAVRHRNPGDIHEASFAFIVRAVNAYEELLAALKLVKASTMNWNSPASRAMDKAIDKAEGK